MKDTLSSISQELDEETAHLLHETIRKLIMSYKQFQESTNSPLLSEDTRKKRKLLLNISLLAYACTWAGVLPTQITTLGINLTNTNISTIYTGLSFVLAYLFRSFWWRADLEFLNSKNLRQASWALHQIEVISLLSKIKKETNPFLDKIMDQFSQLILTDNDKDPYRSSVMGLNFKSQFFELRLPHLISAGAILSCVYFAIKNIPT